MSEGINVSKEGLDLIKTWEIATSAHKRALQEVNARFIDLQNAERLLCKWMLPHDAKPGEKFGVWVGNDLIQVEVAGSCPNDNHFITVRQRTK